VRRVVGDERHDRERRQADHPSDDLEHRRSQAVEDVDHRPRFRTDTRQGDAEESRKEKDRQQVALAERAEDVVGNDAEEHLSEVERLLDVGGVTRSRAREVGSLAQAGEGGEHHCQHEDRRGDALEVEERLPGNAPECLRRLHLGEG